MSWNTIKIVLAFAVMAVSAMSAQSAVAATVTVSITDTDPPQPSTLPLPVANVAIKNATTVVALDLIAVDFSDADPIIGRTTGFSLRIDLAKGATFAVLPVPQIHAALRCDYSSNTCPDTGWSVSRAAGGVGVGFVVYSIRPGSTSTGVTHGVALSWPGHAIELSNVAGLAAVGNTVAATVSFLDPDTAQPIMAPVTVDVLKSVNPLTYSVAPSRYPHEKIDVGSIGHASKAVYAPDGSLNTRSWVNYFDAGTPTIGVATGVMDSNDFPFQWVGPDAIDLTVTGSFGAFIQAGASVDLVAPGSCGYASRIVLAAGTVTPDKVIFATTYGALYGGAGTLCFSVPAGNAQVIDATRTATAVIVASATTGNSDQGVGDGLPMQYNRPVVAVRTFGPAGNVAQQSYLRITNTSAASGRVTVTGKDDTGAAATGAVGMTLAAGQSIQLTADDLQDGNVAKGLSGALGAGKGEWVLTVTGETRSMEVTNANQNSAVGTLNNFGTPVSGAH